MCESHRQVRAARADKQMTNNERRINGDKIKVR